MPAACGKSHGQSRRYPSRFGACRGRDYGTYPSAEDDSGDEHDVEKAEDPAIEIGLLVAVARGEEPRGGGEHRLEEDEHGVGDEKVGEDREDL